MLQDSIELYDPSSDVWKVVGEIGNSRLFHTATELSDGTILVVGGMGALGYTSSVELIDASTL